MNEALVFYDEEMYDITRKHSLGTLIEAHIADLHFVAIDPKTQYEILEEQFLRKIATLPKLDIISIDGDIFDHKIMSNSDGVLYASMFIDNIVQIAREKNSTVVLIHGTYSHDADQLKMFYHYMQDPTIDIRIVTNIQFEYIKGAKILMIPELYGVDESVYEKFLYGSGYYDECFMHGTMKGAVYGDNVGNGRLFCIEDFCKCRGPIIAGHVHKPGCFESYFYYCGTPIRYKHGEEEEKGFIILAHDLDTGYHYVDFEIINSFKYITINLDDIISNDPKAVIDYINHIKEDMGIDYLKVRFSVPVNGANKTVINSYYRNNGQTSVEFLDIEMEASKRLKEEQELQSEYGFILDNHYSDEEKFCMYVNQKEGYEFITVDKLREVLQDL